MVSVLKTLWVVIVLLESPAVMRVQAADPAAPSQAAEQGSASAGKALFTGVRRLAKGGPACIECHTIASLTFPKGGSLGPDLTETYSKLGDVGLDVTLQTLYFPTMVPLFNHRPLTPGEQADLKAFFIGLQSSPAPRDETPVLASLALMGCLILLGITWGFGSPRPDSARRSLLRKYTSLKKGPHELD
jgi:hypothetical protein